MAESQRVAVYSLPAYQLTTKMDGFLCSSMWLRARPKNAGRWRHSQRHQNHGLKAVFNFSIESVAELNMAAIKPTERLTVGFEGMRQAISA